MSWAVEEGRFDSGCSVVCTLSLGSHQLGNVLFVLRVRLGFCENVGWMVDAFEVDESDNLVLNLFDEIA